jgi:hypothetical protein
MEQLFTDILIRIRKGSRSGYAVEAWLSDGSFYGGTARLTRLRLQQLLESDFLPGRYGEQLFKVLLDGPIATAYDVASGLARQRSDERLRIRLLLDDNLPAELHALKWERICNPQGEPLAISGLTPFSRYTALSKAEPEPLDEPVVRLLFVISAPSDLAAKDLALIHVEDEVRRLLGALAEVWRSGRCQAMILPGQTGLSSGLQADLEAAGCAVAGGNATLDNIARRLTGQRVFHFLGHGQYKDGQGRLALEGADGTLQWVMDTDLAARLGNTPVRLVFLAACESAMRGGSPAAGTPPVMGSFQGLAAQLVQEGIPAVVAMQEQLEIDAAYKLTGEFYRRLFLEHGVVDRALNEARTSLYRQREPDWGTPVLYMRLKTGQLAVANPVWTALRAMREHADYADFRTGKYIPLPVHAIEVREGQDASLYEQPDPYRIGTLNLFDAIQSHLAASHAASKDRTAAAPLVLILGGPGTSKSTQMKRLGWETVQAGLRSAGDFFLPVYLGLQDYRSGGSESTEALERRILDQLRLFLPGLAARSLDDLSEQMKPVRLRILLNAGDTLPEAGRDLVRQTAVLARDHPRHQYVVTIQPSSLKWNDLKDLEGVTSYVLVIQPLTPRGVRYFLEAQGTPGQLLLDALHDTSLFDLTSTPYFLFKMFEKAKKQLPPTLRASFLQQLIDAAITQIPADQGMRANASRTLLEMALEMQRNDITVWPIREAFRTMGSVRGERGYKVEELYESLVRQELLLPVGEDAVRFAYPSIQAHCCAQAILALPERDRYLREIVDSLGSPVRLRWWEETLVIASGLLAADLRADAQQALCLLLEPIVYGANLLEGMGVFLAARCLLECKPMLDATELHALVDHVVNALVWRSDSRFEPDLARRLQATQLLAQLAMPEEAVCLARKTYCLVRMNVANRWDYEFSNVRFAAAIALKRMAPAAAEAALGQISTKLAGLFAAWQGKEIDEVIRQSKSSDDLGLQGLAALALGDLHGRLANEDPPVAAARALDRLIEMFRSGETRQNVRWSVADALSLLDSALVTESLVDPLLAKFASTHGAGLPRPAKIKKSLAYLVGLLRLRDERAHNFLIQECLGLEGGKGTKDWSTWATAIVALGRIGDESDKELLAGIAAGRSKGPDLQRFFTQEAHQEAERNYVRREAINALANQGDLDVLSPEDRDNLAKEPTLSKAYYQAIQEIYWRQVAAARAAQ